MQAIFQKKSKKSQINIKKAHNIWKFGLKYTKFEKWQAFVFTKLLEKALKTAFIFIIIITLFLFA